MSVAEAAEPAKALLFEPIRIRGLELKNRVVIAPMATYSAVEGMPSDWHFAHLAKFAIGGAGLIFCEATAVERRGRITHGCCGIWSDAHVPGWKRITDFIRQMGGASGMQIAHSGRKASSQRPWHGNGPLTPEDYARIGEEMWEPVGPSADAFAPGWQTPHELTREDLERLLDAYEAAARRTLAAGFDVLEIHGAHGYLLHSFLSPLGNKRTDEYGGSLEGRMRFPLRVVERVRAAWPEERPLFYRISAVDGVGVGWSIEDSIRFAAELKARGVDVVDCSTGGMRLPRDAQLVARTPGFQVEYASRVRREAGIMTMAVGLIRTARHAEQVLAEGHADLVAIAREALFNPNWPQHAALELGCDPDWRCWPEPYGWWLRRRAAQQGDVAGRPRA